VTTDEPISDGASVPWIIRVLDAEARAIKNSEKFRPIFDQHDAEYTKGGTEYERLCVDVEMFQSMRDVEINPDYCLTFFNAVRDFGRSHWRYPPPENVPGDQAP